MRHAGQMHRATFAAHQAALAAHQLAQDAHHRRAARERVRVPAVRAEGVVVPAHGHRESGCHGLLPEREVAGAFDQVLQE